nr:major outer membrane protein [Campylobacter sp.]
CANFASAISLEDAIKNVDVSGMARYRYDNIKRETKDADGKKIESARKTNAHHTFKFQTNLKAVFDDNFHGVLGLRYISRDTSGNSGLDSTNTTEPFNVYQAYLGYTAGKTTILAGKQVMGTFFTSDLVGTGIKVLNQDIDGLTLAAVAFDALEYNTPYEVYGNLLKVASGKVYNTDGSKAKDGDGKERLVYKPGNVYGAAVIGSYNPVGFQLWYARADKLADYTAVELNSNFEITDDIGIKAKAQYLHSDADTKATNVLGLTDGNFYAGELGFNAFGASLTGGYIGFKGKEFGTTTYAVEDEGSLIKAGMRVLGGQSDDMVDYTLQSGKGSFWFVKAGYKISQFAFDVDYVQGTVKDKVSDTEFTKTKYKEVVPKFTYSYSKKLSFMTWYSWAEKKVVGGDKLNQDYYRFQALYKF